jgi:hypothetical protein
MTLLGRDYWLVLSTPVEVFGWRVNEGAIEVRVSLGTGTYSWA